MSTLFSDNQSPASFLKSLRFLHFALLAGQIVLFSILLFMKGDYSISFSGSSGMYIYLIPIIALAGFVGSSRLYTMRISNIKDEQEINEKLDIFRSANILRLAILEAVTIISIMIYYLEGNALYMIIALAVLLYFYYLRPSKAIVENDAKFNTEDKKKWDI